MSCENAAENQATSVMNLIRSLGPKYLQLANERSENFHQSIHRGRRQKKGLHVEITKDDVEQIFSLRYDKKLRIRQVSDITLRGTTTIGSILQRRHKMSVNHPKHKNEY